MQYGPEYRRLSDAVRGVIDAALLTAVGDETMADAADRLDQVATVLRAAQRDGTVRPDPRTIRDPHAFFPFSPVVGYFNALAAPVEMELGEEGKVTARANLGWPYQGPPGHVHGAVVASIFDELLGFACIVAGTPGMTGRLTVRYRQPTPLHTDLRVEGRRTSIEGRRIVAQGTIHAGDTLCAEAEGLFIGMRQERAEELFGTG